jgi:transcriptional regulator NrdR family protein
MKCPTCGAWTEVKLTKQMDGHVQRSRICGNEHKFTTEERVVPTKPHGGARLRKLEPNGADEVRARLLRKDA